MTDPIASMTGSGSAALDLEAGRFEAEVRSVNHRFLKVSLRTHGPLSGLDRAVEELVRGHVGRGHVSMHVRFSPAPGAGAAAGLDADAFAAVSARLGQMARDATLAPPTVADVLRVPGVFVDARAGGSEDLRDGALKVAAAALAEYQTSRRREGELLLVEIRRLLASMTALLNVVEARAQEMPGAYQDRISTRLGELLEGSAVPLDPAQVAREVALLADRSDVREEIARLQAHLLHAEEILAAGGSVGRRIDFLVQEMHRETNTIGSKGGDLAIARAVVDLKSEVERLREQVQNVE